MLRRHILLTAAATGLLVGLILTLITRVTNPMYFLWSTILILVLVPVVSAVVVRKCSMQRGYCEPSLKFLLTVAFLTEIIPVLGPIFGGTGAWSEFPIIVVLGAAGGMFWSLPTILWNQIRSTARDHETDVEHAEQPD